MTKSAVGDWDTDPDNNTDIADIPLGENQTYPRHVNNAIRELMAQIANAGFSSVPFTVASSSAAASLDFAEDTDNGTNKITVTAPASIDSDKTLTLPNATDTLVGKATTDTLTNKTLTDPVITGAISEDIYEITDGAGFEIDPSNGSIQYVTLGADRTPAATNFANGESVTLHVDDGSARTITWTTVDVNWVGGSAPTLATTGWTVIVLWKWGGQIFGANPGDVAA